jgi:hypothetical protein
MTRLIVRNVFNQDVTEVKIVEIPTAGLEIDAATVVLYPAQMAQLAHGLLSYLTRGPKGTSEREWAEARLK